MFRQTPVKTVMLALLLAASVVYALTAGYYGRELLTEAAILALLAVSLDLAAGYGGMISLCHGALFGVGAYAFASSTIMMGWNAPAGMALAVLVAGAFAWVIGAVTARAHGIFFIMATLAFGQMAYVYIFESPLFGGDDGMAGAARLDISAIGIELGDSRAFALAAVACALGGYLIAAAVLRSGFGRTLVGIHANESRMRAVGLPVWRYKANAFAISGALAGLAGSLAAQHTQFVSPGLLFWTVSGEALVVVILGGLGTLVGPMLGAGVLVFLKHAASDISPKDYPIQHLVVGLVLIFTVVAGGRGIFGQVEHMLAARTRRRADPHA